MPTCPYCNQPVNCTGHSEVVACAHCGKKLRCQPKAPEVKRPEPAWQHASPEPSPSLPPVEVASALPPDQDGQEFEQHEAVEPPPSFDSPPVGSSFSYSVSRPAIARRRQVSILDFFDFSFQHYLTPMIIKVIWGLCLVLAILSVVGSGLLTATSMLPESKTSEFQSPKSLWEMPDMASSSRSHTFSAVPLKLVLWGINTVLAIIGLLIVRVICESIIVLFNIASSLTSIDKKTVAT